jgi:hypothetical protein
MLQRTKMRGKSSSPVSTRKHTSFSEVLTIIGDALAAAASVRAGRQPEARHLRGLGIDPEQFRKIGR